MKSVWRDNSRLPEFKNLEGDIFTDVLVIGGGMAGILTAYFLKQKGIKCVLVEKGRICGGHRTGMRGGNWNELRDFARHNYPDSKEKYFWSAQDCMSLDDIPYIGNYSKRTPDLYVASGFNKWGMIGSMTSAMILSDMLNGEKNENASVFSPSRSILKPQLFVNGFEAVKNLLTPTAKRCPHMGCALKWNEAEHSWDCPCHGSRFEENGRVIDNPANGNLKK